jgi:putative cardiolipin synthase
MRAPRLLIGLLALAIVSGAALYGFNALPPPGPRTQSVAFTDTQATRLGAAVAPLLADHPGLSGAYAIADGRDAFAARVLLARSAQRGIDAQYYIWRNDFTGLLMLDALREAADRGVRVRLLLDDNNTSGLDATLALLDAHPNIEVRLFNPFAIRSPRALGYLTDFARLNRRMHNKSFTVDGQVTVVGGRNVGDEYFGALSNVLFVDLDLLAVGPVVGEMEQDFDRYWNSQSAYPVGSIVTSSGGKRPPSLALRAANIRRHPEAQVYLSAMRSSVFVDQLVHKRLPFQWAVAHLLSDDPAKVLGAAPPQTGVVSRLKQLMGQAHRQADLVSPYFVPTEAGEDLFTDAAKRGVKVRILTNSLEATDVPAVHAGYAKRRTELLQAGISLFELRRTWGTDTERKRSASLGSSDTSLHAKTFQVDGGSIFVGSFNLDQRSVGLNTEMGLVIDSPVLAQQLSMKLRQTMPERAYEVHLGPDGKLYWLEQKGGRTLRFDTEPGTSFWRRAEIRVLSWLPIDWLL